MTKKRYVEVNEFENELLRITCPKCGYPMRVLARDENNIYQCYCASCQIDRFMKDTFDREILTVKQFKRDVNRGKGIDSEDLFDLVYELDKENRELQEFKDKVFNSIDKTIESETQIAENIESTIEGDYVKAVNRLTIIAFKNLKKELSEND